METFKGIRRVLWLTMGLNVIATAAKLIVGFMTGSLSLIADGFDSVFDSASNVVGLVGIRVAERPADEGHPYGHRKAETLTALIVAGLLFLTTWEVLKSAIEHLRHPSLLDARVNIWSFAALLLSIAIHSLVVWYETREGKRLGSDFLIADALHTRADIFVSLSVAGGLIAVKLGFPIADPILAIVIAFVIAKIGIDIIRESSPILMDGAAMPPDEMTQTALSVPGVVSSHRVRSRGHEGAVYADLHIRVDPAMSTEQAHALAHEVQNRLREKHKDILDVTVHVEPADSPSAHRGPNGIATRLRRLADGLGITVHDVWAREIKGKYYVEVHLEADGGLSLRQAHDLASALEGRARQEMDNLEELTTHIEPHGQLTQSPAPSGQEAQIAASVQQLVDAAVTDGACHRVFVQREGNGWSVSLHCRLPGDLKLEEAHRTSTMLEGRLRREIKGLERVIIHTEPQESE